MNNLLNNSSTFSNVNLKDKSNNEKKVLEENLKIYNIYNKQENKYEKKNVIDDISSLSIPTLNEESLNLYKIPKNKLYNKISPNESNFGKLNKNKKNKETRNIDRNKRNNELLSVIFSTTKKTVEDKTIMVSELDRDFAVYENDYASNEIKFQYYNKDMIKKRQNDLKKKIRKNLKLLIKKNEEEKNKNDISNYNNSKEIKEMKLIQKSKNKSQSKIKQRYKKYPKHINHHLIDTSYILNKLKKHQNVEKRDINNNRINVMSLKNRKEEKKLNIDCILYKKINNNNNKKIMNVKLNSFNKIKMNKNLKIIKNQQDKNIYFHKKFKNLNLTTNELNNHLNTFNYTIRSNNINSSYINISSDKIRSEYSSLKNRQNIIFKQDKKHNSSPMIKNKKSNIFKNLIDIRNKTFNNSFKIKKETSRIKGKNINVINMPIKVNINSNYIKIKNYINNINANNNRISKMKTLKEIKRSSLSLMTKKIFISKNL